MDTIFIRKDLHSLLFVHGIYLTDKIIELIQSIIQFIRNGELTVLLLMGIVFNR